MRLLQSLVATTLAFSAFVDAASLHQAAQDVAREGTLLSLLLEKKVKDALLQRGVPLSTAPSGNYAPVKNATCPSTFIRRNASAVSPAESDWVSARRSQAVGAWTSYLSNSALSLASSGFDVSRFTSNASNLPNVGIAVSGGGYRAMLYGAAMYNAFDSRNDSALKQGTGGILQLATYAAGLSGGSWLVGSIAVNDFPTISEQRKIWDLTENLVDPSGIIDTVKYYTDLHGEVEQKADAGFDTSLTDYWGRALSRHLVNNSNNGLSTTYSSIQNLSSFTSHAQPFPIIVSDGRAPGEKIIPGNTTIWEFNPFEFGSRNPDLSAFIPTKNLGTGAFNGTVNNSQCVEGFDNAGFIMGTSATLFNQIILTLTQNNSAIANLLGEIIQGILGEDNDIAPYPNSFQGIRTSIFPSSSENTLDLVDGGEDLENIPLWPLLHPERNVDVLLALDSSADTDYSWPNATALVATRERVQNSSFAALAPFPNIPSDTNTFVNQGLNAHATFFGCNETNVPLLVYIPNHPYVSYSNFSTYKLDYTDEQVDATLSNGLYIATENNTAIASGVPTFPTCLACALVSRAERRAGTQQTSDCQKCFSAYCWNGVSNSTTPSAPYDPKVPGSNATSQIGGAGTAGGNPPTAHSAALARWDQSSLGVMALGTAILASMGVFV